MWMMVKEGGWGALLALFVGSLGILLGIVSLGLLPVARKVAHAMGIVTLFFAFLAPTIGVLGMASGRHRTDSVLFMVDGRGTQARIRHQGYLESQSSAKVGVYMALLPLVLGAGAALLGARRKPDEPPGKGRWILAGAASGVALLTTAGAFAASMGPLPPDMAKDAADLLDARDRADANLEVGCPELERVLEQEYWHTTDRSQWPRQFQPDPRAVLPDFDAMATRCARKKLENGKGWVGPVHTQDVLLSPLLVDEDLRKEVQERVAKERADAAAWGPGGHDIGDSFGLRPGTFGGPTPKLHPGATTVNGRLPPEVIQRIVRQNFGRFRLCYEDGLKKNPTLQGTVKVKFVIGRDGSVSTTSDGGSDLPDQDVVKCVIRGFGNLSFPQPEGGIVTVVYPIEFTPGS